MSDSVRPHGLQPTRLLRLWDSPGKNTGVGCHFLLQCMKVESESEVAQSCLTLSDPMDCSLPGSSIHGIFRATVLEWGAIAFSPIVKQLYSNVVSHFSRILLRLLLCPGDSPGKNSGVGCHFLLQGIFRPSDQTRVSLCLLHWHVGSLPLVSPGKPYILIVK